MNISEKTVSKYSWLASLGWGLGIWAALAGPGSTQALLPYTPLVKADQFEEKGIDLTQQVEYMLRFRLDDAGVSSAVSMARLATQLAPNRVESWRVLGLLYAQQKQTEQSITALQKAVSLDAKDPVNHFLLGRIYFQKGEYTKAQTSLEQGLKIKPDYKEALFDLGNTRFKLGKLPEAIAAQQKALDIDKKFWPAINNIGLINYEQGNLAEAVKSWQEAITIDNKQAEPQLALAVALYKQGKQEEAYKTAKAALTLDGQYADLTFLKENLWGDKILEDTETLFKTPQMESMIQSLPKEPKATDSP